MISFTIYGIPQPQGSARAFYIAKLKRAVITADNKKLKPWRQEVSGTALAEMGDQQPARATPICVDVAFYFDRPKSAKKDAIKIQKPDVDKLLRGLLDALTGICFMDDAQVVDVHACKRFGSPARSEIKVSILGEQEQVNTEATAA